MSNKPGTYTLDLIGKNGTPFRFVYMPAEGKVQYFDRRYTLTPGEPGYGPNQMNENGQSCGSALLVSDFLPPRRTGFRGWHEVDAWDVDGDTRYWVGEWLAQIRDRDGR